VVHHVRMEQIPIRDGADPADNLVRLPGGGAEPDVEAALEPADAERTFETPADPAFTEVIEQSTRILEGSISATVAAIIMALRDISTSAEPAGDDDEDPDVEPTPPGLTPLGLTGAAVGLAMRASEATVSAATSFADTAVPLLSWFTPRIVRRRLTEFEARVRELNDQWSRERPASEESATSFVKRLLPEVTGAVLDQLDLTQLVIDHLDIDKLINAVDLDRVIERVDIDGIVRRVDLDGIIGRVDMVAIADQLIEDIDVPELIRESTNAVTSETVRSVRMRSAEADMLLRRAVDRLLFRKEAPRTDVQGPAEQGDGEPGS
jgi:hypothetical protein